MLEDIEGLRSAIIPSEAITLDDDSLEYEENFGVSLIFGSAVPWARKTSTLTTDTTSPPLTVLPLASIFD